MLSVLHGRAATVAIVLVHCALCQHQHQHQHYRCHCAPHTTAAHRRALSHHCRTPPPHTAAHHRPPHLQAQEKLGLPQDAAQTYLEMGNVVAAGLTALQQAELQRKRAEDRREGRSREARERRQADRAGKVADVGGGPNGSACSALQCRAVRPLCFAGVVSVTWCLVSGAGAWCLVSGVHVQTAAAMTSHRTACHHTGSGAPGGCL